MALEWREWEPLYRSIVAEFGFDASADEAAAEDLAGRLRPEAVQPAWREAQARIQGRLVLIVGAGDEAPHQLSTEPRAPVVAADGATTACIEAGRWPDLVVTDLDGRIEDEIEAARKGAIVAVHAHGDNRPAVREWLPRFPPGRLVGTCQVRPHPPLENHGGFTDGDRAAFLAQALGATRLRLVGFDFTGRIGRYTGRFDPARKAKKLAWARRLLERLEASGTPVEHVLP